MTQQTTTSVANTAAGLSTTSQIYIAATIGMALLLFIGFAPMDIVHNAAHDARHAFAFPCH